MQRSNGMTTTKRSEQEAKRLQEEKKRFHGAFSQHVGDSFGGFFDRRCVDIQVGNGKIGGRCS